MQRARQDVDVTGASASYVRFEQTGMRSECSDPRWTIAAISRSSDQPSPFVDIELHQTFVSHFQQEGLQKGSNGTIVWCGKMIPSIEQLKFIRLDN